VQTARLLRSLPWLPVLLAASPLSCTSSDREGDTPSFVTVPDPAGKGSRINEIADPKAKTKVPSGTKVSVSGAVVIAVDSYDETHNGKSAGTIYVADLGSQDPYAGISLYQPSFSPGNLIPGPGDTLTMTGTYQENQTLPVLFAPGAVLVQITNPSATYMFDSPLADPVDVDITDLQDYSKGRRWLNMLVRVKNVTVQRDATTAASGRVSVGLLPETNAATNCSDPFPKAPTVVNALYNVGALGITKGTVLTELVGVVVFFCNLQIAPRSAADIVVAK